MKLPYCSVITPAIEQLAKQIGMKPFLANNIISAWKTKYAKTELPTREELESFIKESRAELKDIRTALPQYTAQQGPGEGAWPQAFINPNTGVAELDLFPGDFDISNISKDNPYSKDIQSTRDYYTYMLYRAKLAYEYNIGDLDNEQIRKEAEELLREYKKNNPVTPKIVNKAEPFGIPVRREGFNEFSTGYIHSTKSELNGRLAVTRNGKIIIATDTTVEDLFNYIQGNTNSVTSEQKKLVFTKLSEMGYTLEALKLLLPTAADVQKFLAYHEMSHIFNDDIKGYYAQNESQANGINYLASNKLEIELGATLDAIQRMEQEKGIDIRKENVATSPSEVTFISGDASGSDKAWADQGATKGIKTRNTTDEYNSLSAEEKQRIEEVYRNLASTLGRKYLNVSDKGGIYPRRDILQAESADAIFAIGNIINPGDRDSKGFRNETNKQIVAGGTGYAVELGIQRGIPVNIFDQRLNKWFRWNGSKFVEIGTPRLSKNPATIGTRELNDSGRTAIKSVIDNSFGEITQSTENSSATVEENQSNQNQQVVRSISAQAAQTTQEVTTSEVQQAPSNPEVADLPTNDVKVSKETDNKRVKLARELTPIEHQFRTELIARRFSEIVDAMIGELLETKQEELNNASAEAATVIKEQIKAIKDPVNGRRIAIDILTLKSIYSRIKQEFIDLSSQSDEELIEQFGEEMAPIMRAKYQATVDNFAALFDDSCALIEEAESLRIISDDFQEGNGYITKSVEEEANEEEEFGDDPNGNRTTGNEGWSYKVRFVDPYSSLSAKVKRALSNIYMTDSAGDPIYDDLGNIRYMTKEKCHAILLDELSSMIDSKDFAQKFDDGTLVYTALENAAKKNPWIYQVISEFEEDKSLASQFYADMRKDFISYWKQKLMGDGIIKSFALNGAVAQDSTMDFVRSNYEHGISLSKNSIYKSNTQINQENIEKGLSLIGDLLDELNDYDGENLDEIDRFVEAFNMIGFNTNPNVVKGLLESNDGLIKLMNSLRLAQEIMNGAKSLEEGKHLIDAFDYQYKRLANIIGEVSDISNVSNFREGTKNYPSYSAPNYVETMIKSFKSNDRRQSYIDTQFKQFPWFYDNGEWQNEWLKLLETDEDIVSQFETKEIPFIDRGEERQEDTEYTNWRPNIIKEAFVLEYFSILKNPGSKKQFAWYNMPIFSDSPIVKFIKFIKYDGDFKSDLKPLLRKVVKQELARIKLVEQRRKIGAVEIQNFDKVGDRFHFFPELNDIKVLIDDNGNITEGVVYDESTDTSDIEKPREVSFLEAARILGKKEDIEALNTLIDEQISTIMDNNFNTFMNSYDGIKLIDTLVQQGIAKTKEGAVEKLEEYFWNQNYATSQIIQLTTTDLAFYKDDVDFQKRYKEVYAAGTKLNTNSQYGRQMERVIYLSDLNMTSGTYDGIKKVLKEAEAEGRLSKMDVDSILYKFRNITATDAQAMRDLTSFRAVLDMMGLWNGDMQATFDRLESGEWNMSDYNTIWQTIKPFVFTQIDKPDGTGNRMKVPHQNKNSEFLLLSMYNLLGTKINKSPQLRALNRFMKDYNIDVAMFESAVKAGGQGVIDINYSPEELSQWRTDNAEAYKSIERAAKKILKDDFDKTSEFEIFKVGNDALLDEGKITQSVYNSRMDAVTPSEDEVYDKLVECTTTGKNMREDEFGNSFNEETVHFVPYDDYVVQQPTPEHLIDAESIFGSQFRNLIISDLPIDIEVKVGKSVVKGRDNVVRLYQKLIIENLIDDFKKVNKKFDNIETLQKALFDVIKGNPKYGKDIIDALQIVEHTINGEKVKTFNIPLHTPGITAKIQEIVNAFFKNNITKQKIKGGNCILVSNFGFTNELQVAKNPDGSIKEVECYMPFYTKKFFEPFLKPVYNERHQEIGKELDIEAIRREDSELLKLVGYRIPTEGKYSMLPLVIKGFLPQQNGSTIMLPAEVTQIAGSDFDVDKLFMMIPEFSIIEFDKKRALEDFKKTIEYKESLELVNYLLNALKATEYNEELNEEDSDFQSLFKEWFEKNKEKYRYTDANGNPQPLVRKVKYNTEKEPHENSRRARNNALIDISFGILTHKSSAEKINNPGSFDRIKKVARITSIIDNPVMLSSYMKERNIKDITEVAPSLLKESLKYLDKFLKKYKAQRNVLTPDTFIYNHVQNMTGGILIGIYANNTTMQAKHQHTSLSIRRKNWFEINGRAITSLHDVYTEKINGVTELISKNCAEFSAASVDNVKDPVLADLMQNKNTAGIAGAMLRMGMTINEIGLLFTSPLIKECISKTGGLNDTDLKFLIARYNKYLEILPAKPYTSGGVTNEGLILNTLKFNRLVRDSGINNMPIEMLRGFITSETVDTIAESIKIAEFFRNIIAISEDVKELTSISRADSPNGARSNTLAGASNQIRRVQAYVHRMNTKQFTLNMGGALPKLDIVKPGMSTEDIRNVLYNSSMPLLQAFFSLGIESGHFPMSKYFIQLSSAVRTMEEFIYTESPRQKLSDELVNTFYKDLVTFALSRSDTFGNSSSGTFDAKRDYYLYDYPKKFIEFISDPANKELVDLNVIGKLAVKEGEIQLYRAGRVTAYKRSIFMRELETLLDMNHPNAQKLAIDLFRYAYYKDGFSFGPNSIGNFFSPNFISRIPDVANCLRDMSFQEGSELFKGFLDQFYANYYLNGELVKDVSGTDAIIGTGDKLCVPKNDARNRKSLGGASALKYVSYKGKFYKLYTTQSSGQYTIYDEVKTHNPELTGVWYNANETAAQMAEKEIDEQKIEEAKKVSNVYVKSSMDEALQDIESQFSDEALEGLDDMLDEAFADEMDDMLSGLESGNYDIEEGLSELGDKPCGM